MDKGHRHRGIDDGDIRELERAVFDYVNVYMSSLFPPEFFKEDKDEFIGEVMEKTIEGINEGLSIIVEKIKLKSE